MALVRRNVLFCYSRLPSFTNAVRDYVQSFGNYSEHRIHYFDMDSGPLDIDLAPYDCVIFNYCFWARCLAVAPDVRRRIRDFSGLKIAILQDEYDYFLWHEHTLVELGIQTIVTCVPQKHWRDVFRGQAFAQIHFINALTGYVPQSLLELPAPRPLSQRKWAIGYRSRAVPFAYGRLTQEKRLIGERMKQICFERGVAVNIDNTEESRIYGDAWTEFISNCRTVLGTESGSNVFDFHGTIKPEIDAFLEKNPDADFDTVHRKFLQGHDDEIRMNQVSPRIFEAIALRAGLILFEGEYSGVVQPWVHYIPLKKDFGNIDEVLAAVDDLPRLEAMIERAYRDVIESGKFHFRTLVRLLDDHITSRALVCTGYEPVLGVIGWRISMRQPLQILAAPPTRLPTASPLHHDDQVLDPVVRLRFDPGALRRAVLRRYESVLYSGVGRRLHSALQTHAVLYRISRKLVRLLTLRR